jgi:hypothetical protein
VAVFAMRIRMRDDVLIGDNDYSFNGHISVVGTSDVAWGFADQFAQMLADTVLADTINIYSVSIRNPDVINGNQTRPVDHQGTSTASGSRLPAWNVAEYQFKSAAGRRPSTFYLRPGIGEGDVDGQVWSSGMGTRLDAFRVGALADGHFCDAAGALFTEATFSSLVRLRQMGWHRRTRVGFHRGWVPNA